jgi:hypothetical protein
MRAHSSETSDTVLWLALVAALCIVLLVPIWFASYPPLLDWPNHLARMYILAKYDSVSQFQEAYELRLDILPNLGGDILGMWLLRWVPYYWAAKVILSLIIIVFAVGCVVLYKGLHGKLGLTTVLALFFVYNFLLLYGFVNYMLGVGLFLLTYGYWLQSLRKWTPIRTIIVISLGLSCYFTHLSALVFLTLAILIHAAVQAVRNRQDFGLLIRQSLLPLTAPLLLVAIHYWRYGGKDGSVNLRWEGFFSKMKGIAYLFATYNFAIDFIFASLLVGILLAYIRYCRVRYSVAGIAVATALFAAFLLLPTAGYVGLWGIDRRFTVPAAIVFLLSIDGARNTRSCQLLAVVTLLLIGGRVAWIWLGNWTSIYPKIEEQVHLFEKTFRPGDRVYPVTLLETQDKQKWVSHMPFRHVVCYSVIVCHAFTPSLFAYPGQQPLRFRDPSTVYTEIFSPCPDPEKVFDVVFLKKRYDYVYGYRLNERYKRFFMAHFALAARQGDGWIFKTERTRSSPLPPPPHPSPDATATGGNRNRVGPPARSR